MAFLRFPTPTQLKNILTPTANTDAATKGYVDDVANTISAGQSSLEVSLIDASDVTSNVVSNISAIRFDTESGFDVNDLGNGEVKIAMNSTFKYWNVNGQPQLVASGLDTIEFVSSNGVIITTSNTDSPQ